MPDAAGGLALDQAVGADHALRALTQGVVDHQQMVRDGVVDIAVTLRLAGGGIGPGANLLVANPVT